MADNAVRDENCAIEDIGQEGKTAVGDKRVSEVDEGKGQTADRSSEETNSTTATPASYSREGYLESSGNYSAAGGCFNPTVEALQEGIVGLVRPTVEALDARVGETRKAQAELRDNIELLTQDLEAIRAAQQDPSLKNLDLETAINKLNESKKRVVVVANLLKGAQDRLNRVHQNCLKETAKRRTLLEPGPATATATVPQLK